MVDVAACMHVRVNVCARFYRVWQQGPNYAFAKLVQRWRAIVSRHCGHVVVSNVAPASLTESVMHNRLVNAGMRGCEFFGIVPFTPRTSTALMTALMIHDLNEPKFAAWFIQRLL